MNAHDPWHAIRAALREGETPAPEALLDAMRSHGVPADMGVYIADRFTALVPRRRGRPANTREQQHWNIYRARAIADTVHRVRWGQIRAARHEKVSTPPLPHKEAIRRVADYLNMGESTVRNAITLARNNPVPSPTRSGGMTLTIATFDNPKNLPKKPPRARKNSPNI
jgi:hypothetical protein